MAVSTGAGLHQAYLTVNGTSILIASGSVEQRRGRKVGSFGASFPMSLPGVESTLANLGDNVATLSCMTRGQSANLITGEIDRVDFDYVGRIIHVSGRSLGAKLHEIMSSEKWANKKGDDIVKDIAGRVGLGFKGGASSLDAGKQLEQDYVKLSDNVSLGYIVQKCAEFDGATWFIDGNGVLNYVKAGSAEGTYTINYSFLTGVVSDAMHLRVSKNVQAGKNIKVTVKSWHPKDKKTYSSDVTIGGNGGPSSYTYHLPNLKQDHTDRHAKSRAGEVARNRIQVDATVAGDPSVNVEMGLQLNGTSFAGTYEIDCVTHHVGKGHMTHITARTIADDAE